MIANPIYDAVFKFMMEDKEVATLLIQAITGFTVEDIELRPTDVASANPRTPSLTVYRLDFAARIRLLDGTSKLMIIEIQKAKFHTDIMRFRRYLGSQYSSDQNAEDVPHGIIATRQKTFPIYSIYLLGHILDHFPNVPIIKVNRTYTDGTTAETLAEKDEFIESLTHDSAIIQIPVLSHFQRTELERVLSIFDQTHITPNDHHGMTIREEDYPEPYRPIIRRLLKAIAEEQIRQQMINEDAMISEWEEMEREALFCRELAASECKMKEEERRQKEEERRQKEEERRQKEEERRQKEDAIQQKQLMLEKVYSLARIMKKSGIPIDEIMKETGLSKEDADKL